MYKYKKNIGKTGRKSKAVAFDMGNWNCILYTGLASQINKKRAALWAAQ
jgi:hypothetical protein